MFEISKLKEKKLSELQEIAEELKISKFKTLKKLDLVYKILDHQASNPQIKEETPKPKKEAPKPKKEAPKKLLRRALMTMILQKRNQKDIQDKTIKETILETTDLSLKKVMEIEILEIDIENLIMNLMQSLKVKVY